MELKERIVFVIGLMISFFGFILTSMCIIVITATDYGAPGEDSIVTDLTMGFFLGIVPLLVGGFICKKMVEKGKRRQDDMFENELLTLVAELKGKITTAELAANTKLSIMEAEKQLETYVKMGVAERHITEGGVFVYWFRNIISDKEKYKAKNIYDT